MRIPLRKFNKGIYIAEPEEGIPDGALTRARGIDKDTPWKSRPGSTALCAGDAHSIDYFNNYYFLSTGTALLASTRKVAVKTGLSGRRLASARMNPTAGFPDCLFYTGGGRLFKIQYEENQNVCGTETYLWTVSGSGTDEYYLTSVDSSNYDLSLSNPVALLEGDVSLTTGTVGSLTTGTWDFADNDALGFNTIYVRLADSTTPNPNNQDPSYLTVRSALATNWGISPPPYSPTVSSGGGGVLTGRFTYRITYRNALTGTRSNPSPELSTESDPVGDPVEPPAYRAVFLCHADGTHNSTAMTDDSGYSNAIETSGSVILSTAQQWQGSASIYFPGSSDSLIRFKTQNHNWLSTYNFGIDFRVYFTDLSGSSYRCLVSQSYDTAGNSPVGFYLAVDKANQLLRWYNTNMHTNYTWNPSTGVWYHIAIIRGWNENKNRFAVTVDGSTLPLYSGSEQSSGQAAGIFYIGPGASQWYYRFGQWRYWAGGGGLQYAWPLIGYIDEIRWVVGTAPWTDEFSPASVAYGAATGTTNTMALTVTNEQISLTNFAQPYDTQVTDIEIWRTQANGSALFYLTSIPAGVTTFVDNIDDEHLGIQELPLDNSNPYAFFDDCIGPHNGSMFWITRTQRGERGRLYYSQIGRAEAMEGFIEVSSDDDGLQKLVYYQGQLGVFSKSRFFQILGSNPYTVKEVTGIPGTVRPHAVAVTPYGIAYEASDRTFRVLTGINAARFDEPITRILSGEAVENLTAWGGGSTATVGLYARGEYIISDSSQTLAYDFTNKRWRDLGIGCLALYYNDETDQLIATVSANVLEIEKYGELDDSGTAISYEVQTASVLLSDDKKGFVQWVYVDIDTNTETLTCKLVYDGGSTLTLGTIQSTAGRAVNTFAVSRDVQTAAVRLTGSLSSGDIYLYGVDLDVYIPGEEVSASARALQTLGTLVK